MRRKIILHGPSSMTISLPSSWVKSNNLKKGEELEVIEEDNILLIKPVCLNSDVKSTEISLVGLDKEIRQDLILALHKNGYDEIKINFDNPSIIKELHVFLNDMQLGFEIIRQESDAVVIRNISNPGVEQFDNLFRRVFRITIEYSKKIEAIMNNKEEITQSCLLHETSINRISNYCKRIIIMEKQKNGYFFYAILEELIAVSHSLTNLLVRIMELDSKLTKKCIAKYTEVTDLLIQAHHLHYKFTYKDYSVIRKNSESLKKQISELKSGDMVNAEYWDYIDSINNNIGRLLESALAVQM